jgi:hypothetical protein
MSIDIFQVVCVACCTTVASPQNLYIHECHIHMLHKTPWHLTSSISLYQVQIMSSLHDHHVLFMEYITLKVSFFPLCCSLPCKWAILPWPSCSSQLVRALRALHNGQRQHHWDSRAHVHLFGYTVQPKYLA